MHYARASTALLEIFFLVGCSALHKQTAASLGSSDAVASSVSNADLTPRFPAPANDGAAN
jgi:hypothetical protein